MPDMLGYVLAIVSSIFFSLYVVPRKLSKLPALYFSLLMSMAFFVGSVLLYALKPVLGFQEVWSSALWWAVLAGAIWAAAFVTFIKSIDAIGLARSNQWKNLQGPIGVMLALVFLGEWATTNPLLALLAGFAVFASAICFTIVTEKEDRKSHLRGVYLAATSGLGFGTVALINKYITIEVGVYSQQVVWSFCIFLSLLAYALLQKGFTKNLRAIGRKDMLLSLAAGFLYLGASVFMLQSFRFVPGAIAFTLIQLSAVWTILIGLFVFNEIDARRYAVRIVLGFTLALAGIGLLVFARL